jgi:hypothetical protein
VLKEKEILMSAARLEVLEDRRLLSFPLGLGASGADVGNSVIADRDGNVIVAGRYTGSVDFDPGSGVDRLTGGGGFVAKYTPAGALLWARRFDASVVKLAIDRGDNVYAAGSFDRTVDFDPRRGQSNVSSSGGTDGFVVKLSPAGNLKYVRTFGGGGDDAVGGLAVATSGEVYLAGTFGARADFNPESGRASIGNSGGLDGFVVALDNRGHYRWAGSFAGPDDESVADLDLDPGRNILVTGRYLGLVDFDPLNPVQSAGNAGTEQAYAFKWNNDGEFVWLAGFGGTGTTYGTSITSDRDSNVIVAGQFDGTSDFDPRAGTFNLTAPANGQTFVTRLNAAGNLAWAKAIGGSSAVERGPGEVSTDKDGNVYTTGRFSGTQDFDPNAGTQNLDAGVEEDVFVSKLDADGDFVFARNLGGNGDAFAVGSVLDRTGNILTTGGFKRTIDFDPGVATFTLSSQGDDDLFVSKLTSAGVAV